MAYFTQNDLRKILAQGGYNILREMSASTDEVAGNAIHHSEQSILEQRFLILWNQCDGPPLEREFRFCPKRRWRADFYHESSRTLIEIEGGTRRGGRHNRHEGFSRDAEKYNTAVTLGYYLFRLSSSMITEEHVRIIIDFCVNIGAQRMAQKGDINE